MDTPPSDTSGKLWLLPLLLLGVAASLFTAFWFVIRSNLDQEPGANVAPGFKSVKLSRDESLRLIDLRNHAIGHLENLEFSEADAALVQIISLLPTDPFGPRNLAICRQLAFKALDKMSDDVQIERAAASAKEAIDLSKRVEPKSPIPWIISARVATNREQNNEALKDLREALQLDPQSIPASYDLFALTQSMPEEASGDEGFQALRRVYQKESNNLFVIKDLLPMLAQRRDSSFLETMSQVRDTIAPFFETIKTNSRVDLKDFINKAIVGAQSEDWSTVQRSATVVRNLLVFEAARDLRYVSLNSLEFILPDFGDDFRSRADLPPLQLTASNPVHFVASADHPIWPGGQGIVDVVSVDFDLNGRPDVLVLSGDQLVAMGRDSDEKPWQPLAITETKGAYTNLLAFDFDDDVNHELKSPLANDAPADALRHEWHLQRLCHTADPDVIAYGPAGLKLFENKKEPDSEGRSFVSRSAGTDFDDVRDVVAAAVADIDNDGDLDLVVSAAGEIRVFSNRGNLSFEEITARSVLPPAGARVTALAILDWDRDSDIDILVSTTSGAGCLENVRHGRLRYRGLDDFTMLEGATSLGVADFDGNLSWDILASGPGGASVVVTHRTSRGLVAAGQTTRLTGSAVQSARIGDIDNDGAADIVILDENGATIHSGDGAGGFKAAVQSSGEWLKGVKLLTIGDLDRDGDLDLFTIGSEGPTYLSSQCRESDNPANEFLEIHLIGYQVKPGEQNSEKRTNHINVGGMLELKSGQRFQAMVVTNATNHFGLGARQHADLVRVLWTNGIPSDLVDPVTDQPICIEQKLLGSCPYLYTWNGERFEFVTDLLWNAPLGLKFAENVIAPWREWEYIKIDGSKLKSVNGEYQLRVTAELWEAEYFDQFKLFAVDHPVGTEVFTNEKVGPAELATHQIHTVQMPRAPVAARDTRGRDVLDQVINRDEIYTKTFDRRVAQGFTEEHFLELDLGDFPSARNVMLYLTGWMYPGSTSLSVQHSQNPDLPKPRPPALYVQDENREWKLIRPFMGFPGGKTKTIAIDVSGIFPGNDHRLRIVSTMEIFWDHAFFTVDDPSVETQQAELTLTQAKLVDRGGVSFRYWPATGNGPDQFVYENLIPGDRWPAMTGYFTKYGDVLPLLTARDDHLVVTGSGDEIRLTFAEPQEPLQPGWVRDFVLYTVGWDKDADLNTVYGDTVEPLPFEQMTVYALHEGEPRAHDESYRDYLQKYQTREQNPTRFWKSTKQWKRE